MKKYIALLFTFAFIFSFNTNLVGAISGAYSDIPGCSFPGQAYSVTTGQACGSSSIPQCAYGDIFNAVTGKRCQSEVITQPVCDFTPKPFLKVGSRGADVVELQQKLKDLGLLSGKADGVYGKMTESARQNYFKKCPMPPKDSGSVVISSVSGPQKLDVGEEGAWNVNARDKNGGSLTYSVLWGDEDYKSYSPSSFGLALGSQVAEFTHVYSKAGNYTPKFTVTSENTIRCITTPCPSNGGTATTSLSVKVGETTTTKKPKISYISPNYGVIGSEVTIYGTGFNSDSKIRFNGLYYYYAQPSSYTASSLTFTIPEILGSPCLAYDGQCTGVPPLGGYPSSVGTHVVSVANSNTSISNEVSFKIRVQNPNSITVLSPNGGETLVKGEKHRIKWTAPASVKKVNILFSKIYECTGSAGMNCIALHSSQVLELKDIKNNGSYEWYVPATFEDGRYEISVVNPTDWDSDVSDSYFTIMTGPMCDYAAPPEGCKYLPGANYNKITQCGMVLVCY